MYEHFYSPDYYIVRYLCDIIRYATVYYGIGRHGRALGVEMLYGDYLCPLKGRYSMVH